MRKRREVVVIIAGPHAGAVVRLTEKWDRWASCLSWRYRLGDANYIGRDALMRSPMPGEARVFCRNEVKHE